MKIENDQYKEKDMGPLFDICSNNHGGNPMSVQANKIASRGKSSARQQILFELQVATDYKHNLTCEELEAVTKLSHQTCSARLSELRREGKIKIVGERKTRSGALAAVYQANG
jgi:hypothetical protein